MIFDKLEVLNDGKRQLINLIQKCIDRCLKCVGEKQP